MFKKIKYFAYYLETFAKNLNGRGNMDHEKNGEFQLIDEIIKSQFNNDFIFFDGGANVGTTSVKLIQTCKVYNKKYKLFSFEPFEQASTKFTSNLNNINCKENIDYTLIKKGLSNKVGNVKFYYDSSSEASGQNSLINHHMLDKFVKIQTTTIDDFFENKNLAKIDFLKLDIEGYEYMALLGARKTLSKNLINYIQLEYNQTWIEGGGSIKKILDLCKEFNFKLFIISNNCLYSIPSYSFVLDDFFYCNLLMVHNNSKIPMKVKRKAIPII